MENKTIWPTIEELDLQESELILGGFDEQRAYRLGTIIVEEAKAISAPIVINIRTQDRTLFHAAMPGSLPDNEHMARRKTNLVFRYLRSSLRTGVAMKAAGEVIGPERGLDPMEFAPYGGGFPIRVRGVGVVAAVGISGMPQLDDHAIIVRSLRNLLANQKN